MAKEQLHVAVVGLGFGSAFTPIYDAHPLVGKVTVCDVDANVASRVAAENGCEVAVSLDDVLADPTVDAVHLLTPLHQHAQQSVRVLEAGKHCACAVTMGMERGEIAAVVAAARRHSQTYMMMETGLYTREAIFAKDMHDKGELGSVTFARGDYYQDLDAPYPAYWRSVPPIMYSTHSLGPILGILGKRVASVSCIGTGRLPEGFAEDANVRFPMQVAHFRLAESSVVVQINRAWYKAAHSYVESFSLYGDLRGFEWAQLDDEYPVVFELAPVQNLVRWRDCSATRTPAPYRPDLFPDELGHFAEGGHGGSHPHLVHEFLSAIVECRPASVDENVAANWTLAGIVANESSLKEGAWLDVPIL